MNMALPAQPLLATYGQGIHDVPPEQYYRRVLGEANKGALDVVERSLLHYRHWVENPEDTDSDVFRFGRALHASVLEPDTFAARFPVLPDFGPMQSKANREARDAWLAKHGATGYLLPTELDLVLAMQASALNHPLARKLLFGGISEVTLVWTDPETGLPCKARGDKWQNTHNVCADVKGVLNASYESFARAVVAHRYHVQHAHYCDGFRVIGAPVSAFPFICIEKEPPHAIGIYTLDPPSEERGYALRNRAMERLAGAMQTHQFPGYNDDKRADLAIPAYGHYD